MHPKSRAAGALGAALALAVAAACTDDAEDGGDAADGQVYEETRLVDMVNESARLLYDLENAEFRIIQHCLEADGFTVHDQFWFHTFEPQEQESLFGEDDWGDWLPPLEEARQYGLGTWATTEEGANTDAAEAYFEYRGYESEGPAEGDAGAPGSGLDLPDNSAFEALSPQEQYDWYVAYFGEAAAVQEYGYLVGADASDTESADTGEIDLGGDFDYVQPEPGGCQRQMIDALGYELALVEDPEGMEYRSANWSWRPVNPVDDVAAYEAFDVRYQEALAGVRGELVDCLAERGHPGWEFDEEGSLPLSDYFYELYEGTADVHDHPDLPDDAPTEFESQKEFEIAFAVDLAECGDETGYREAARQAWGEAQEAYYLSIETSVYAWQEEIRGILTRAQDVIEA